MSTLRLRRPIAIISTALLAGSVLATPANAGDTRNVFVGSGADGALPSGITISEGEEIPFVLTVKNEGKQTLNNVRLALGRDDDTEPEANPQRTYVPTQPTDLPPGVTVTAAGAAAPPASCDAGGQLLVCKIGTLTARQTLNIDVTLSAVAIAVDTTVPLKATITVSEVGNDNGANTDTFAAEGSIRVLPFSCESVAAYRSGPNKTVSTCVLGETGNTNFQSASVTIPSRLTQVTLTEGVGPACPEVFTCYGDPVDASILGDDFSDVVAWTIEVNLTENALGKPNLQQLVVIHVTDAGVESPLGGISLAKKNACKSVTSINCGNAWLTTATDGDSILNVYVQTQGNGGIRVW